MSAIGTKRTSLAASPMSAFALISAQPKNCYRVGRDTKQRTKTKKKKNTDLWEENCPTGTLETPQRFWPPSPVDGFRYESKSLA